MYTCERFQSMGALVVHLRAGAKRNPTARAITRETETDFHGAGGSWDAALEWAERGDNRNLDRFADLTHKAKAKIARKVEKRFAPSFARSGAGSISMGRYMDGVPDCIVRMKPGRDQLRKGGNHERVIKIYVSSGHSSGVRPEEIEKRGAYICGIIEALAAAGRKVELWAGQLTTTHKGKADFKLAVCIKKASDRLHVETARFALCNPCFSRRLLFGAEDLSSVDYASHFENMESRGTPGAWGARLTESDMANEFSLVIPGMLSTDSYNASYHIEKIEECLKTAGILH